MQGIKKTEVRGKRVLVRCDFNVPLTEEGEVADDLRIKQAVPTIRYLVEQGARVVLLTHLDIPLSEKKMREGSLKKKISSSFNTNEGGLSPIRKRLAEILEMEVKFINDCIGKKVERKISHLKEGEILLLENVRIYKEEKENSPQFSKAISLLGDIYVNNAFSVSHREHASVAGVPQHMPSFAGLLLQREIEVLDQLKEGVKKPVVAIVGGNKIQSKIAAIRYFLDNADHVLLGGKIANTVLIVRKIVLNAPWPEEEAVKIVEGTDFTSPKVHLPVDVLVSPNNTGNVYVREAAPGQVRKDEDILDIGSETIKLFKEIIEEAGTIIWAGPLGYFENEKFEKGTHEIGRNIAWNHSALKIVGGGDTGRALAKFDLLDKMDHVSCGGGALLTYINGGKMPGLDALR